MVQPSRTKESFDLAEHVSQLLPLPAGERTSYLEGLSAPLAQELRELLAFETSALDLSQAAGVSIAQSLLSREQPEQLGRWTVERQLGQGGMGTVYLVSRNAFGVTQQAAAKVGFAQTPENVAIAAIQREADALSRLQHGNVATLLDFGVTQSKEPFVVSEYVEGELLLDYGRTRGFNRRAMLHLFRQLLSGVSAVHAQLVLHLDIKPNNVLVTDSGTVKLIDFGLAGVLSNPDTKSNEGIAAGYTHAYASPEQLKGQAVTVQSDIYSLGRVLADLISAAADGGKTDLTAVELQSVVEKATHKDPKHRYGSAPELDKDIDAILSKRPVAALPGRPWYRWRKFAGRHWLPLLLGFATFAALAVGLISTGLQYRTTLAERDRALRLLESEAATSDFMSDSLRTASVFGGGDADATVGEMIAHMVQTLPDAQDMSHRTRAWLAGDLAAVLTGRGEMTLALEASELAVASAGLSDEIEDDIAQWTQLALTAGQAHQYDRALAAAEKAQRIAEPIAHWRLPWAHLARMQTLLKMKRWRDVEASWAVIASIPTDRQSVRGNIDYMRGTARIHLGQFAGAADDLASALSRYEALYGEQSAPVADTRFRQFQLLVASGEFAPALAEVASLIDLFENAYGAEHYRFGILEAEIGLLRFYGGDFAASRTALTSALDLLKKSRRSIGPTIGFYQTQLARVLAASGRPDAAVTMLNLAMESLAELPDDHVDLAGAMILQGELSLLEQQSGVAAEHFTEALQILATNSGAGTLHDRARLGLAAALDDKAECTRLWDALRSAGPHAGLQVYRQRSPCLVLAG